MKKLLCLSLITLAACNSVTLLGSESNPDVHDDLLHGPRPAAEREAEIRNVLKNRILKEKEAITDADSKEIDALVKEIAKKELERDVRDIYSEERARQQGAFIATRDAIAHQHNHSAERARQEGEYLAARNAAVHAHDYSPERAEREGEYLAAREKAKRKNDTFLSKLPNALEDGALSAISALVQQAGVVLGVSVYKQAQRALTTDATSPEEKVMLAQEKEWVANIERLERQMQHDATYMAFVKATLEADATKKATAKVEEEYKKFMQKKAEEQAKADALKAAIAEQQGAIPSAPAAA